MFTGVSLYGLVKTYGDIYPTISDGCLLEGGDVPHGLRLI